MQTIYLHGMPGAPVELASFGHAVPSGWIVPDRGNLATTTNAEAHFRELARLIQPSLTGEPVRLVGFSLGAVAAIRLCPLLPCAPAEIHLVSPAAPLQCGDFLPHMAGRAVFSLARSRPFLFRLLTASQAMIARLMPNVLVAMVFAEARGDDRALIEDGTFKAAVGAALRQSLGSGRAAYCREVEAYTQDWSGAIGRVGAPVHLWHGEADNWSPPGMSDALAQCLPATGTIHRLARQSHYSTLRSWLDRHG